jgi:hypothetical protein
MSNKISAPGRRKARTIRTLPGGLVLVCCGPHDWGWERQVNGAVVEGRYGYASEGGATRCAEEHV